MKNIIIKETTWYNDKPEEKEISIISSPMDMCGTTSSFNITNLNEEAIKEIMNKAFVFNSNAPFLVNYKQGMFPKCHDAYYREYTIIREFIETDKEETKDWRNGWKSKVIQEEMVEWTKLV